VTEDAGDAGQKDWLAGVFDRAASTYDRVGDSYHDHFGTRLVESAGVGAGHRVLDVACGRGAVLLPAAERVGDGGSVVGVDLSTAMADAARAAATAARLEARVDVRPMDAEHLELPDDSFDVVLCAFGLFFFPRPERAAEELVRVTVPGGAVGVSTWGDEDDRWSWEGDLLAGLDVPRRALVQPFDEARDVEQLLSDAGLDDVRSHTEHHDILFASESDWWAWQWSFSIRGLLEQIDDEARERYRRAAFEAMQPQRQPAGFPMRLNAVFAFGRKPSRETGSG
jgi:ubiquinone/menaquinone biosynthesis C-methylase UbiE